MSISMASHSHSRHSSRDDEASASPPSNNNNNNLLTTNARVGGRALAIAQLGAILRKNLLVRSRGRPRGGSCNVCAGTTGFLIEVALPLIFLLLCCLPRYLAPVVQNAQNADAPVNVGESTHDRWTPQSPAFSLRKPAVMMCPDDDAQPDVTRERLSKVARSIAASVACDAVDEFVKHESNVTKLIEHVPFPVWIFADVRTMLQPGWTPPPEMLNCVNDCESKQCVDFVTNSTFSTYDTTQDALDRLHSLEPAFTTPFVVTVKSLDSDSGLDYAIRMNHTDVPSTKQFYFKFFGEPPYKYKQYWAFVNVQSRVDRAMIGLLQEEREGKQASDAPESLDVDLQIQTFPWIAYTLDVGAIAASGFFSLLIIFAFILPAKSTATALVEEKEQRQREGMLLLGLSEPLYWTTWFITSFGLQAISSLGMAAIGTYCFRYSNPLLLLCFYLSCSFAVTSFAFFMSTLFSTAKVASVCVVFLYIAFRIPGDVVEVMYPNGHPSYYWTSLLPPCAMGMFVRSLVTLEIGQFGVNWDTLNIDVLDNPSCPYTALDAILFIILDGFLYLILTWYFDKVMPKPWGTALPPWFLFAADYWFPARRERSERKAALSASASREQLAGAENEVDHDTAPLIMPPNSNREGVHLRGLTKVFDGGKIVAVDNVDLSMNSGEITCLLGHNGAGKTTTISMLTGMLPPSAGDATIKGKSVAREMTAIRQSLGLVPQFDILWDSVTVREHLEIYSRIKGAPTIDAARDEAVAAARSVDLSDKIDTPASALSGGQRRKLSLAIAYLGNPSVVFLDEPTSGMDPYARRFCWDLIRKKRESRVVVLTTHFLDEADLLADRIAIMAGGKVAAAGTPIELKTSHGCGYTLTVTLSSDSSLEGAGNARDKLAARVAEHADVPSDCITGNAAEMRFELPQEASPQFPKLLRMLEDDGASLGVSAFGLSCTTLEDVFLKVGEPSDVPDSRSIMNNSHPSGAREEEMPHENGEETRLLLRDERSDDTMTRGAIATRPTLSGQFSALLYKRWCWLRRDKLAFSTQLLIPVLCVILAQIAGKAALQPPHLPSLSLDRQHCMQGYKALAAASASVRSGGDNNLGSKVFATYPSADEYDSLENSTCTTYSECHSSAIDATLPGYLLRNWFDGYHNYDTFLLNGPTSTGPLNASLSYVILANQTAYHAIPAAVAEMDGAILRSLLGGDGTVRVRSFPLPFDRSEDATKGNEMANDTLLVLCVSMAVAILSAGFAVFIVRERECGARHVQFVSGVSGLAYWTSAYVADMIFYLGSLLLIFCTFFIFKLEQYMGDGALAVALILILFAMASLPLTYLLQRIFTNEIKALTRLTLVYFLFSFITAIGAIIVQVLAAQDLGKTRNAYHIIEWVFRIVPHYCVAKALFDLSSNKVGFLSLVTPPYEYKIFSPLAMEVTGWNMVFLAIEAVAFSTILLLIECPPSWLASASRLLWRRLGESDSSKAKGAAAASQVADDSVRAEHGRVSSFFIEAAQRRQRTLGEYYDDDEDGGGGVGVGGGGGSLPPLCCYDVHKVYPSGKMAISQVAFAAERGQVFGLLGVNGAGKTSMFRTMTGETVPTSGDALVCGTSIISNMREARTNLGYAPQFDATLPLLTAREHLQLYARLRGATVEDSAWLASDLLRRVGLTKHADKPSHALSGGNRRKLSVGIALVSAPSVVLLDEPSTGMDAGAKRSLWRVLDSERAGRAVVLTTHSMEECEATCQRLTIMVDGACRTIGTLQEVKTWYGTGYTLSFRVSTDDALQSLDAFLRGSLQGIIPVPERGAALTAKYRLPDTTTTRLSDVFTVIEQELAAERSGTGGRIGDGGILEYAISQSTLEDCFLRFAATQEGTQGVDDVV